MAERCGRRWHVDCRSLVADLGRRTCVPPCRKPTASVLRSVPEQPDGPRQKASRRGADLFSRVRLSPPCDRVSPGHTIRKRARQFAQFPLQCHARSALTSGGSPRARGGWMVGSGSRTFQSATGELSTRLSGPVSHAVPMAVGGVQTSSDRMEAAPHDSRRCVRRRLLILRQTVGETASESLLDLRERVVEAEPEVGGKLTLAAKDRRQRPSRSAFTWARTSLSAPSVATIEPRKLFLRPVEMILQWPEKKRGSGATTPVLADVRRVRGWQPSFNVAAAKLPLGQAT